MARIELKDVGHCYGPAGGRLEDYALQPFSHVWEDGGAYALLGPSGCGKTTFLNIISGLVHPTRGRVLFDGRDVTALATAQRNIAQVFQFPVIYKTKTVHDNLAFPLRCRNVEETEIRRRVQEVAALLNLESSLKKPARQLTADAKQLISLGRGLVREDVAAILLDEPLTVIDPQQKWLLRRKLKEINTALKQTMVYVTHDQNEAMTFADHVAVMDQGKVMQIGTPQELFECPQHTFVGWFIGSPAMNILPCTVAEGGVMIKDKKVPLPALAKAAATAAGALELGIRPEFVQISDTPGAGALGVDIREIENLGNYNIVMLDLDGLEIKAKISVGNPLPDRKAFIRLPEKSTHIYASGQRLNPGT